MPGGEQHSGAGERTPWQHTGAWQAAYPRSSLPQNLNECSLLTTCAWEGQRQKRGEP